MSSNLLCTAGPNVSDGPPPQTVSPWITLLIIGVEVSWVTSVIIAISVSGETYSVIDHVSNLKRERSTVVSITNSENCTIAKISDLNISYYVQQEKVGISDITTQIPVLYMIESIGKRLHNKFLED